jgi:hypothetical protein
MRGPCQPTIETARQKQSFDGLSLGNIKTVSTVYRRTKGRSQLFVVSGTSEWNNPAASARSSAREQATK